MPQLDPLILFHTCCENTLFFWVIYLISVRLVLSKVNNILNIRKYFRNVFFYNDMVLISNLYHNNVSRIYNLIYKYFNTKQKSIINILSNKSLIIYYENSYQLFKNSLHNIYNYNLNKYNYSMSYLITYNKR